MNLLNRFIHYLFTLLILTSFISIIPSVSANNGALGHECITYNIAKVALVINAGAVEVCITYEPVVPESDSTWLLHAKAAGPDNAAGIALTYTWTIPVINGCTNTAPVITTTQSAASSSSNLYSTITMTSPHCQGIVQLVFGVVTPITIFTWQNSFNADVPVEHHCSNDLSQCARLEIDNQNRLCDASTYTTACNNPEIDNLNRLCDASTWAASCNNPEINNQNRICSNSEFTDSCNILSHKIHSGNQTICLVTEQDGCGTSIPEINIHQDEACGATITCQVNTTSNTVINNGNVTTNQNVNNKVSFGQWELLLIAIVFFAIMGEFRGDVLYWFFALVLSIFALIIRPTDSVVPVAVFIGWLLVCIFQMIKIITDKRTVAMSNAEAT